MFFRKAKRIEELERENRELRLELIDLEFCYKHLKNQSLNVERIQARVTYPDYVPDNVLKKEILLKLLEELESDIVVNIERFNSLDTKLAKASLEIVRR